MTARPSGSAALLAQLKRKVAEGDLGPTTHKTTPVAAREEEQSQAQQAVDWSDEDLLLRDWLEGWECVKDPRNPERHQYPVKEYLRAIYALGPGSHYHTSGWLAETVRTLRDRNGAVTLDEWRELLAAAPKWRSPWG